MTTPALEALQAQLQTTTGLLLGMTADETCPPELRDAANKLRLNMVSTRLAVTSFEDTVAEYTASMRAGISEMKQMFAMLGIEDR